MRRWKVGLGYDEHQFENISRGVTLPYTPPARRDIYPFPGVEWVEDRYEKMKNVNQIHRVEDQFLGTKLSAQLGYAARSLGSDTNAWLVTLSAGRGYRPAENDTLLLRSKFSGRWPQEREASYLLEADARYYHKQSKKRLFFAQLSVEAGQMLDTDSVLTLGGDTGLRAYPVRYQSGGSKALLTLEQRFYSDWYPFHLFRVGVAIFFEAGEVWQTHGSAESKLGLLKDVGVGLRIGSPHSATGRMLHIDIAYPLDGPRELGGAQLYIETRKQF